MLSRGAGYRPREALIQRGANELKSGGTDGWAAVTELLRPQLLAMRAIGDR
jgi:hypothetical protein